MFQKIFQKIINSSMPLLFFGGTILFLYLSLELLAWGLLDGEIDSLLDRYPFSSEIVRNFYYLFFLFLGHFFF